MDLLKPDIESQIISKQSKQQYYANYHSKVRNFVVGEPVYVRNFGSGPRWLPGHVSTVMGNVSAKVALDDNRIVTRHEDHIRKKYNITEDSSLHMELPIEQPSLGNQPLSIEPSSVVPSSVQPSFVEPSIPSSSDESPLEPSTITSGNMESQTPGTPISPRYPSRQRRPPDRYSPKL